MPSPLSLRIKVRTRSGQWRTARITKDRAIEMHDTQHPGPWMVDKHYTWPWGWSHVIVRNQHGGTLLDRGLLVADGIERPDA